MRRSVWAACLLVAATAQAWEKLPPPDHKKANVDGMQGVMFASGVENERGDLDPVRLPGCQVYLASQDALHERLTFPCNEWFLPEDGTYFVWLATDDRVSASQSGFINHNSPYKGFGSVAIHDLRPAGFVTVGHPVPADHTVRYTHLDAPGVGFSFRVPSRDADKPHPIPPGRVVAGIFNARNEAVAYHAPVTVEAGETTSFRIAPPARGADLVAVLHVPRGYRDVPLDIVVRGAARRGPDVRRDQGHYVFAVWYGLAEERVTFSASSPTLELKRELDLRPGTVATLRADVTTRETQAAIRELTTPVAIR